MDARDDLVRDLDQHSALWPHGPVRRRADAALRRAAHDHDRDGAARRRRGVRDAGALRVAVDSVVGNRRRARDGDGRDRARRDGRQSLVRRASRTRARHSHGEHRDRSARVSSVARVDDRAPWLALGDLDRRRRVGGDGSRRRLVHARPPVRCRRRAVRRDDCRRDTHAPTTNPAAAAIAALGDGVRVARLLAALRHVLHLRCVDERSRRARTSFPRRTTTASPKCAPPVCSR